ncbi:EAL domain-containing protein [Salicola sp. Rm-C-2C1-2]|uniref:EAL domain-containing protein n=1 Tax=Salicola sp. Rm-C-2C1-2 TaxID=3141321 RepID=UPI0032E50249
MPDGRNDVSSGTSRLPSGNHPFAPLIFFIVLMAFATVINNQQRSSTPVDTSWYTPSASLSEPLDLAFQAGSIAQLHSSGQLRSSEGWQRIQSTHPAVGFKDHPITFRLELTNEAKTPNQQWVSVPAPYIDRIRVARLNEPGGPLLPMRTQGQLAPLSRRTIALPSFHWPVTIPGRETITLFFEVTNSGPTLLPISIEGDDGLVYNSVSRATINGVLLGLSTFLLAINVFLMVRFRTTMLTWLTVLTAGVIHIQLVLNGFGAWLFWGAIPSLGMAFTTSMLLVLIAFLQHTVAALHPARPYRWFLNALSLAALLLIFIDLAAPTLSLQPAILILGSIGCIAAFAISVHRFTDSLYARYFTIAVLILTTGYTATALRTVGILPVNVATETAFSFATILAAIVLLAAAVHFFLREQQLRRIAATDKASEQEYRIALQNQLEKSLRTHKLTGRPNRSALEAFLSERACETLQFVVLRLTRFHEVEHVVGHQLAELFVRDYLTSLENHLQLNGPSSLVRIDNALLISIDTMHSVFILADEIPSESNFWQTLIDVVTPDSRHQGYTFNWLCSIGVASLPRHGNSIHQALSAAGYASLQEGTLNFYDNTVGEHQRHQQLLMLDLEDAFTSNQVHLAYQPKVSLSSGQTESVEALIRWYHPRFHLIPPGDWIPLVEELGSITRVTRWVLARAAVDLERIRSRYGMGTRVAINISSRDLALPELADSLEDIVRNHGRSPQDFILEITETAVIQNLELTSQRLGQLRRSGFSLALDDFGTGTSSLSALTEFPLDEVKIDRRFLTRLLADQDRQKVFRTTVELAQSLSLDTVVEGIEDEQTVQWLRQFTDLKGQGFFWGQPVMLDPDQGNAQT